MGAFKGFLPVKKVVAAFSALWMIACAAMYWSMHYSSWVMIIFFVLLAGAPIAFMWGLLMLARYLEKVTALPEPKRGLVATKRSKKVH